MFASDHRLLLALRRFTALACAALVVALGLLAASPEAHEHLHEDADHEDHACAVVLFAHGVALAVGFPPVVAPALVWSERPPVVRAELFLAPPRYLRQPERGPPADC